MSCSAPVLNLVLHRLCAQLLYSRTLLTTVVVGALLVMLIALSTGVRAAKADRVAYKSFSEHLATATASEWRTVPQEDLLYMTLPTGRVIIALAPEMAPNHVANIRALIREGYFDGLAIVRSQDNYVAQWGEPVDQQQRVIKTAKKNLEAEYTIRNRRIAFDAIPDRDGYAPQAGFHMGFPAGRDPRTGETWLTHCYGMVGVGRGNENNSGSGASLYAVIGHAPRHLDRNITVVGRVLQGMPLLSQLPRGTGRLGFYEKAEERTPLTRLRVGSDLLAAEQVTLQVLRSDSASFKVGLAALRNRGGDWFKRPAGYVEICNVPPAVRVVP
jgi:cyclophilin family peptidyl-prolyl cis-trans isomerase